MGRFFWCVSNALIHWCLRRNMPKACPFVVICAIAYCGGHESSHIIKAHTDSTRFNEKIIRENLWEFVADFLEHGLHGLYGYVGFVESC